MIIRKITEDDFPEIAKWFESIQWDLPAVEGAIPKDGYVAQTEDGRLVACAWIYLTGTGISFVQWTNTNPAVKETEQSEGISRIIKTFQEVAPQLQPPIKAFTIYTKNEKFKDRLKTLGFRSSFGFYQCTWVAKKNGSKPDPV